MPKLKKETPVGTIRIKTKTLKPFQKTKSGWKPIKHDFQELLLVVKLFKSSKRFDVLVDKINPQFLKGQLSPEGREQGARINILPNGKVLEKAFSLFSPHLRIHDQLSHDHWDVLYQNRGGTWSYVYTLEKRKQHRAQKYQKVDQFDKRYPQLVKNINQSLTQKDDYMALPMHTLLNTYMRVGNETYFKAHGHKGLTTLMKKDLTVKGNQITFNYIGKDGVPITINHKFSTNYVQRLRSLLKQKKPDEFVFAKEGHPLHEHDFKTAFTRYCGQEFYPHIVRSHFATMKVKKYLSRKRKLSKEEVENLYFSISHQLGHRKFNKKTQQWQEHYTVTVNSYIQPQLVEKVGKMIS